MDHAGPVKVLQVAGTGVAQLEVDQGLLEVAPIKALELGAHQLVQAPSVILEAGRYLPRERGTPLCVGPQRRVHRPGGCAILDIRSKGERLSAQFIGPAALETLSQQSLLLLVGERLGLGGHSPLRCGMSDSRRPGRWHGRSASRARGGTSHKRRPDVLGWRFHADIALLVTGTSWPLRGRHILPARMRCCHARASRAGSVGRKMAASCGRADQLRSH